MRTYLAGRECLGILDMDRSRLIPDTLSQVPSKSICFLHIDLNAARPEVETLRYFWEKITPGGYVVLDDYGWPLHIEQKKAIDELGRELGFSVLSLPTGQGIIQKKR